MSYDKTLWQNELRDAQGNIIQPGTKLNPSNMNKIEQGIEDAHTQLENIEAQTTEIDIKISNIKPVGSTLYLYNNAWGGL